MQKLFHKAQEAQRLEEEVAACKKEVATSKGEAHRAVRELDSLKSELESERRMHARTKEELQKERQTVGRVREECDHQVAKLIHELQDKESIHLQDQHLVQELKDLQQRNAELRRQLGTQRDEKNAVEVEAEELRRTLMDRSNDATAHRAQLQGLQAKLEEAQAERRSWELERAQLVAGSQGDMQQSRERVEQLQAKVAGLEKSLAALVNEKRVWEVERTEMHDSMAQIQQCYQEERDALESKVQEIESAFNQAIELEMRRHSRTPDRLSLNSQRSSRSGRSSSVASLDFENPREGDGIDLDENMLRLLGSLPQDSEDAAADSASNSTQEAERLCQLAARAQLEGRVQDAEALCQLAYESYRGRGATALEAYRSTPPQLRQFMQSPPSMLPPSKEEVAGLIKVREEEEECIRVLQQDIKDKDECVASLTGQLQSSQEEVAGLIKVREAEEECIRVLQQDIKDTEEVLNKATALQQEREEEAQVARRQVQTVQLELSVRTTELRALREKLAKAEQEASGQRLKAQQEIKAIREQFRAREEIMPVRENQPKEEQAAKSAREKCVVCQCLDQKVSMAVCNKGHAVCKTCFEGYTDAEMTNGQRQFRCPLWPAHLARCTGRFSEQNVAQILSPQLHERYMRGMREQIRAEEYQKSHQVVHRIASELKAKVPGISQEMLEQQLRQSCKGARQCGNCHFGPVLHHKCSDLRSHHEKDGYNNRCPHCGWFAEHISDWPPWNGKVSSAAFVTPTSNVDIAKPSADPSAGSEESQDIAEPSADPSAGSEESQTHPGCISRGAFTWLVPRWWRERNDAALVHRSASVER